jgi:alpha-L-arabinofuranosidase B-like protein
VSAVVSAAVAAVPAQAVPAGDVTLTMTAADIGADPATLRQVVNDVNAEDVRNGVSLDQAAKRWVEEYGGDPSGWISIDITASVTADGAGLTFTVPAAEVQTTAGWWATLLSTVLGIAAGYGLRALCIAGLTATGVGVALVPLICTPFGGAMTALVQSLIVHGIDGDIGTKAFWTDTLIKMAFGAVGGFAWEKWLSAWAKGAGATAAGRIGNWLRDRVPGISSWFGTSAGTVVEEAGDIWIGIEVELPLRVADFDANRPPTGPLPCDVYDGDGANCVGTYSTGRALYSYYGGPLYQVQRGSDKAKTDIGLLAAGGYVNAAAQDSFYANTSCTIVKIYDQSAQWNDLTLAPDGGAAGGNHLADATALPITVNGHKAYGVGRGGSGERPVLRR